MASIKPSFRRAWRRTFWHVYDNLGLLMLVNFIWLLVSALILFIPAGTIAVFYIAYEITCGRPVKINNFFRAVRKYFLKSTLTALLLCTLWFLLLFNIKFYLQHFVILAGVSFWLCIFSLMCLAYIPPLLCRGCGVYKTIKYSCILAVDNFGTTLLLGFYLFLLICLEILVPILGFGVLAVFLQNVFLEIEKRYNPQLEISEPRRNIRGLLRPWEFS